MKKIFLMALIACGLNVNAQEGTACKTDSGGNGYVSKTVTTINSSSYNASGGAGAAGLSLGGGYSSGNSSETKTTYKCE